ncbi:MAG: hypothetical protein MUO72_11250 [Bacteroidales bacterium]|nr:hypothetical protein [Bacteroidales bacterium]
MKKVLVFLLTIFIMLSCSNVSNIKNEDICGKRYTSSTPSAISEGVSFDTGTTLKCDGTFESGAVSRMTGFNSVDRAYFTGNWEVIKEIPDEVRLAVKKYGLDHNNYSIIKYSSSNGVNGYCLYYRVSYDNSINFEPLYMGQVAMSAYENEDGALGIFGGFLEE